VFCRVNTTLLQGVLQGFYNIFTRSFARFLQYFYKVFCKAFTALLQGVLQGFYNIFYKVFSKAVTIFLQGVQNRCATAVKPCKSTCTNCVEAVHEAFVQML
jgi:hypothetical protein